MKIKMRWGNTSASLGNETCVRKSVGVPKRQKVRLSQMLKYYCERGRTWEITSTNAKMENLKNLVLIQIEYKAGKSELDFSRAGPRAAAVAIGEQYVVLVMSTLIGLLCQIVIVPCWCEVLSYHLPHLAHGHFPPCFQGYRLGKCHLCGFEYVEI